MTLCASELDQREMFFIGIPPDRLLLCRPLPIDGEAWGGYVLRLVRANHLRDVKQLAGALSTTTAELLTRGDIRPNEGVLCKGSPRVGGVMLRLFAAGTGRSLRTRVCSECLRADAVPHLRRDWERPFALTCRVHRTVLIDTCPSCRTPLTYRTISIDACRCGFKLAHGGQSTVDDGSLQVLELYKEAQLDDALGLCATRSCNWIAKLTRGKLLSGVEEHFSHPSFLTAYTVAFVAKHHKNWPQSLLDVLEPELLAPLPTARIAWRLGASKFSSIRKALKGTLRSKARRQPTPFTGTSSLMACMGLSRSAVYARVGSDNLPGASLLQVAGKRSRSLQLTPEFRDKIRQLQHHYISVEQAALAMGTSPRVVRGLAMAGWLQSAPLLDSAPIRIEQRDAHALLSSILRLASGTFPQGTIGRLRFTQIADLVGPVDKEAARWGRVMTAICLGFLSVHSYAQDPKSLDDIVVGAYDALCAVHRS